MQGISARSLGYWTLAVFVPSGLLLIYWFRPEPILEFLSGGEPIQVQLASGVAAGLVFGYGAWALANRHFLSAHLAEFARIIRQLRLSTVDVWFVSICAGVGEELFFRGGLQPLLGIWPTAILFVAIHGYLNPFSWRVSVYGVAMCGMMAVLGYLTEQHGILSAMIAHCIIDVILLNKLRKYPLPKNRNFLNHLELGNGQE
jgi:uncharacterized protein